MNKTKFLIQVRGKVIYPIFTLLFNFFDIVTKTKKNQWCVFFTERHYSDNCKYYFEYLQNEHSDIDTLLLIKHKNIYNQLKKTPNVYYQYSWIGFFKFLTSKVIVISNGSDFFYFLPYILDVSRKHIVNLWHGPPIKKVGLKVDKFRELGKSVYLQKNTLFFVASDVERNMLSECFNIPKINMRITGSPRTDPFFQVQPDSDEFVNILYAPTWREYGDKTKFFPFEDFDIYELIEFCKKYKVKFYMRAHRYDMKSLEEFLNNCQVPSSVYDDYIIFSGQDSYPEVQDLLIKTSILITDYSSIYIDYLLLDRPILFVPYDFDDFELYRGCMFDFDSNTPGPKALNFSSFKSEIINFISGKDIFLRDREIIKNKFHFYTKGNSCHRITEEIKNIK